MDPAAVAPPDLVIVRLGGSRYALPMASIAEVGRQPGLTCVPGLPGWVAGVANWRGRVLAVLAHLPPTAGALLAGQVTDEQGPYGVLDLDAVFALASTLPRARRAG